MKFYGQRLRGTDMNNRYFEVNKDGYNIRAKIYYGDLKNVKQVVLFGHGFGGHMDNKAAEKFAERLSLIHI